LKDDILNVVYDTETAESFGSRESGGPPSNPFWYKEILYRNLSGYWFLAGEGGSQSHYAIEDRNLNRFGAAGIIPIGRSRAMQWLAETGKVTALREFFPDEKEYIENEYNLKL
jgi:hypothetical protein